MDIIQFKKVSFAYPNQKSIYQNISFEIAKGEFVSIIGKNGCGKSTIAKLLVGLLLPQSGEIIIDGMNTREIKDIANIRKKVGLIFQNPEEQIITTVVCDEIAFGLENISQEPKKMKFIIMDSLRKVGMEEYYNHATSALSGGQQQRISIASILAMKPDVIVLDEATSMLDPNGRKQIMNIMKELQKEGISIINITHKMNEVIESSRTIVIGEGRVITEGTPMEIFSNEELVRNNNLEVPFVIKLRKSIQKQGIHIPDDITDIRGILNFL